MIPIAVFACAAILATILQTWFDLQWLFVFVSDISMFIGFIAIALVRWIYRVLVKRKKLN